MSLTRIALAALLIAPAAHAQQQAQPATDLRSTFQSVSSEGSLGALRARQLQSADSQTILGFARIAQPAPKAATVPKRATRKVKKRVRRSVY